MTKSRISQSPAREVPCENLERVWGNATARIYQTEGSLSVVSTPANLGCDTSREWGSRSYLVSQTTRYAVDLLSIPSLEIDLHVVHSNERRPRGL